MIIANKSTNQNIILIRNAFREYYFRYSQNLEIPEHIEQHEFGYMQFGAGMVRHLSFRNIGELLALLVKEVPSDVYCSNAYYRFPTYAMQEKQLIGADLIFDIDAKDLHLPCEPMHSYFICTNCSEVQDSRTELCTSCNSGKLAQTLLACNKCNYALKKEVKHLVDLLMNDLGIKEKSIRIYFSGNNGYHIHVLDDEFYRLDSQARSDIVGYLMGNDIMTESIGVRKASSSPSSSSSSSSTSIADFSIKFPKSGMMYGWRRRLAKKLGIDQLSISKLDKIVQQKGGYSGFKSELLKMTKELGVRVDPMVTVDVHRVFRMAGTVNSKSGLTKIRCKEIESFDPSTDACFLMDREVNVNVKAPIKLKLKGQSFSLKKQTARLPAYAAIYLISKKLAQVTDS
jgi:DNA primase small subunit